MIRKNNGLLLAAAVLTLTACKNSGDDPLPPNPNPPAQNQPPTANAGADQLVLTGAAVSLSGSGSDSDGTIATLAWTQTSGTAVTLAGAGTGTPTFTAPATAGSLIFQLSVTDNSGASRTDSVTVDVNSPPAANAGADQAVTVGTQVALSGAGTDANGTVASYAWTQTAGAAVTLTGGTTAAPTFTAPSAVGTLQFQLTVTDNQGATSSDSVSVSVNMLAAPVIVRQPTNIIAFENGIGLIFVVAQGENLNYEWHYDSGAPWTSGPEPYMIRGGAVGGLQAHDDCYYVIISNAAGSVTSEPGCMHIIAIEGTSDPSDPVNNDNANAAQSYGNAVLEIMRVAAGAKTGPVYPGRSGVPWILGPGDSCYGATLDGAVITQGTNLPLGQHTITQVWNQCDNGDPDEPRLQGGGIMITYDFPNEFGVGTYTMYLSGHGEYAKFGLPNVMNGILTVTSERSLNPTGVTHDDFEIELEPHFSAAGFRLHSALGFDTMELHRTYYEPDGVMTDAWLDFRLGLETFDDQGYVGTVVKSSGSSSDIKLHFEPGAADGEDPWTSEGHIVAFVEGVVGSYYGARLSAAWGQGDWHFFVDELPPPDFPGDDN